MIVYKHIEPKALEKSDVISDRRELHIEAQRLVELTVEMDDANAWRVFNRLPEHVLPVLPQGYRWVCSNRNYSIIRNQNTEEKVIKIVLYGPDKNSNINFICIIDDVTTYSFAHTQINNHPGKANPPMSLSDYRVIGYDYSSKKYKGHVRGHLIDHQDTIMAGSMLSTHDRRNYIPEPPEYEWGLGIRRLKVKQIRDQPGSGAYAQFNSYSEVSLQTSDGTLVPEDVRFFSFNPGKNYIAKDMYHVEFEEDMKRPQGHAVLAHAATHFMSSLNAAPIVATYSPEMSDRALRLKVRNTSKKEQSIVQQGVFSRYLKKDQLLVAYDKGDDEFESAGHQLHAGILTGTGNHAVNYIKRSLFFADQLNDLDDREITLYSANDKREGKHFFDHTDEDLGDLNDQFRQLTAST
jgi:hypothetical protein